MKLVPTVAGCIAALGGISIGAALQAQSVPREHAPSALSRCLDVSGGARMPHDDMVWVPSGDYVMGDDVYPEEGPLHSVHVAGFWMDRHEVTNAEFAAFVKATGFVTQAERIVDAARHPNLPASMRQAGAMVFAMPKEAGDMSDITQWWRYVPGANWRHPSGPGSSIAGRENYPVVNVTYADALAFARWKGRGLPDEAQWEWAARGADPGAHPDHRQPRNANTWQGSFPVNDTGEDGFIGLAPVGCYAPNRLGLYDMIGNVWEWTSSVFRPDHSTAEGYGPNLEASPQPGAQAVPSYTIKGGSYLCAPNYCMRYRAGARESQEADLAACHLGFRTILRAPAP